MLRKNTSQSSVKKNNKLKLQGYEATEEFVKTIEKLANKKQDV